jgi:uncharacterized membrane protein
MLEVAGAILLAVLILVFLGEFVVVAAVLFGVLLTGVAGALVYFLRVAPAEVALGIVAASVLIGSISREAGDELRRDTRAPQRE